MHPDADPRGLDPTESSVLTRRALLIQTGIATLSLAGIAALAKGSYRGPASAGATNPGSPAAGGGSGSSTSAGATSGASASQPSSLPTGAVKLAPASRLGNGQAAEYRDPATGQPDILIRQPDGSLNAFSAVCTHAGCTVGYQGGEIVCPCHGGVYSATTGAVISGPPPQALAPRKVLERGGEIYAAPS
jgi:thiosulfate dehydrogenase [quinone] large subunit